MRRFLALVVLAGGTCVPALAQSPASGIEAASALGISRLAEAAQSGDAGSALILGRLLLEDDRSAEEHARETSRLPVRLEPVRLAAE